MIAGLRMSSWLLWSNWQQLRDDRDGEQCVVVGVVMANKDNDDNSERKLTRVHTIKEMKKKRQSVSDTIRLRLNAHVCSLHFQFSHILIKICHVHDNSHSRILSETIRRTPVRINYN